ncbi:L-Aspartase-like protein [Metarhizium album ARSEF 1941]|uniref:L-Aspartase-like protein n=1 Tax=Metarhizium album (strain ARSEF 1941) TaxID=1081103 RepID=A0A0B2X822_METAS|nr:L-Aspartase-like protein [Metarhizium album ARSEF 1941]KHO01446.1 L-Aspartase-like protein [Metarhizium album ARSEF 1941]
MHMDHHSRLALSTWRRLSSLVNDDRSRVLVNGESMSIADVVAISRHGHKARIDDSPAAVAKVNDSVDCLRRLLDQGHVFYGVGTGFGGSANTRSVDTGALQVALMQMQQCGVLSDHQCGAKSSQGHDLNTTSMPEAWVRAAMAVRCNSLVRGHSAVRFQIIEMLERLLNEDYIPLVPLRGSISASGDLSPLSYIAGVLEGNPKLFLWTGSSASRTLINASQALKHLQLEPVVFGPKEALGLVNGTAVSAAVATLALNQVHQLTVLSQILTAMAVEALRGTTESFHPFLAAVRPHLGQIEAARNILGFLRGSRLATPHTSSTSVENPDGLYQDRYPLRTSTQWIGPLLEDLVLADRHITTELNSTTDNPVIDVQKSRVFHGGNFQASTVTSAMDKARSALQMMGKMLFSQCTEMMNPSMSNGLPPNLVFDEPSASYAFKGIDIAMAAYTSELGFLAQSVAPHVQSAEMANQAINSLALLSARYTHTAIDTFSMLTASYIYSLCQALDLRVIQVQFEDRLKALLPGLLEDLFAAILPDVSLSELKLLTCRHIVDQFKKTTSEDSTVRFRNIAASTQAVFMTFLSKSHHLSVELLLQGFSTIPLWAARAEALMQNQFDEIRHSALTICDTPAYLCDASKKIYEHVRVKMGIPFNRGLSDHPSLAKARHTKEQRDIESTPSGDGYLIGDCVSRIYDSIRSGDLVDTAMQCLADVVTWDDASNNNGSATNGTRHLHNGVDNSVN